MCIKIKELKKNLKHDQIILLKGYYVTMIISSTLIVFLQMDTYV